MRGSPVVYPDCCPTLPAASRVGALPSPPGAERFAQRLVEDLEPPSTAKICVCPPFKKLDLSMFGQSSEKILALEDILAEHPRGSRSQENQSQSESPG